MISVTQSIRRCILILSGEWCAPQLGMVRHCPHPWKHRVNRLLSFPLIVRNNLRGFSGCLALRFCM